MPRLDGGRSGSRGLASSSQSGAVEEDKEHEEEEEAERAEEGRRDEEDEQDPQDGDADKERGETVDPEPQCGFLLLACEESSAGAV